MAETSMMDMFFKRINLLAQKYEQNGLRLDGMNGTLRVTQAEGIVLWDNMSFHEAAAFLRGYIIGKANKNGN